MWKQTVFCGTLVLSLLGLILPTAGLTNAQAESSAIEGPLIYTTDRPVYTQGEVVRITVTNTSNAPVAIVDRTDIDGGFATIERQAEKGQWRVIELYAAANVTVFRALEPGARCQYLWQTVGYNRADTIAQTGTYRIRFGEMVYTNPFEIKPK